MPDIITDADAKNAFLFDPASPWSYCDGVTQGREVTYLLQRPIPQGDATIACTVCHNENPQESRTAPVVSWMYLIEETDPNQPRISRMRLCLPHLRGLTEGLQRQLARIEEAQPC